MIDRYHLVQSPGPLNPSSAIVKLARVIFPSGDTAEFSTLQSALNYVARARAANAVGADGVAILNFVRGEWIQIVEQESAQ